MTNGHFTMVTMTNVSSWRGRSQQHFAYIFLRLDNLIIPAVAHLTIAPIHRLSQGLIWEIGLLFLFYWGVSGTFEGTDAWKRRDNQEHTDLHIGTKRMDLWSNDQGYNVKKCNFIDKVTLGLCETSFHPIFSNSNNR